MNPHNLAAALDQVATEPEEWNDDIGTGERRLIDRARTDPSAFAALYRRHYPGIGRYLYARTGDRDATEDLLSETFLAALKGLRRYRHRGLPFRCWLLRIATNAVHRRFRRDGRAPERLPASHELPGEHDPLPRDAERESARVRALLSRLSPRHEEVLVLHYMEGLEVNELASVLRCRPGTIKSRLSRAREALRRIAQLEA